MCYHPLAYFMGTVVADVPQRVIPSLIFSFIAYFMIGLNQGTYEGLPCFVWFLILTITMTFISYGLCLTVSCIVDSFAVATIVTPMFLMLMILPTGFLVNIANLKWYWKWLEYVSFFKYGYQNFILNEFTGLEFSCTDTPSMCPRIGNVTLSTIPGSSVFQSSMLDIDKDSFMSNFYVMLGFVLGFMSLTYVMMHC